MSFTLPLTASVIAVSQTSDTTLSSSDCCMWSSARVAVSSSEGNFTLYGLFDSRWDLKSDEDMVKR